jgi:hypothetical protein
LAASVVIEQNDQWLVGRRYLSAHSLEAVLDGDKEEKVQEELCELTAAWAADDAGELHDVLGLDCKPGENLLLCRGFRGGP